MVCVISCFFSQGNFGSAFIEVLVSDSSHEEEMTLLHAAMLMTAVESRTGRNKTNKKCYSKDKLSGSAVTKKWNRVKVRCMQKYNLDIQFGLRSLSIFTDTRDPNALPGLSPENMPAASHLPSPSLVKPKQETPPHRNHHQSSQKYPSLPSSKYRTSPASREEPSRASSHTPKRLKESTEELFEDFEFSGVERQSRLFHDCMKGKATTDPDDKTPSNRILDKIAAEKEKYRESGPSYQRKKLLKKGLSKADLMRDFVESYKERKSSVELTGASRKLSSHGMLVHMVVYHLPLLYLIHLAIV